MQMLFRSTVSKSCPAGVADRRLLLLKPWWGCVFRNSDGSSIFVSVRRFDVGANQPALPSVNIDTRVGLAGVVFNSMCRRVQADVSPVQENVSSNEKA